MRAPRFIVLLALAMVVAAAPASAVLSPASIPAAFEELLSKPSLSNPAMVLIDGTSGEVIYEKNSYSQRKPASVMKIFSGAVAIKYLDTNFEGNKCMQKISLYQRIFTNNQKLNGI